MIEKISYERRVYESVDDKNLSRAISQISTEKRIHASKGKCSSNDYSINQKLERNS